jgi:THO complex subunit 3
VFATTGEGKTRILSYPDFEPVFRFDYLANSEHGKGEEFMLTGHTSSCVAAELQPNGRYLATGGTDSIIALWDTTDWICQRTISKLGGPVRSISEYISLLRIIPTASVRTHGLTC